MSAPTETERRIEEALEQDVRPGLSAHAGSVLLRGATSDSVELELVGSCRSCYFRVSCAVNLIAPTVRDALPGPVRLQIRGISDRQLARLTG